VAAVQYTFTYKQYTEYRGRSTHNNQKKKKRRRRRRRRIRIRRKGKCGPYPIFASYTLAFALQLRKTHGKTSVTVYNTVLLLVGGFALHFPMLF
jgi:hypothetical protein